MSCEICGRGACTRSFHSLEEQQIYEDAFDKVRDKLVDRIERFFNCSSYYINDDKCVVDVEKLNEFLNSL